MTHNTSPNSDFKVLSPEDRDELARLISIYQEAIEPSEQKSADAIAGMASDPRYVLMVAENAGAVNGFSISMFPPGADFFLLEYMAVSAVARGQRLGEALFDETYRYGSTRGPDTMLLEVDQPGRSPNAANDTEARYRFYRRMGCRRLSGVDYILPLETGGTPPPMMLLVHRQPAVVSIGIEQLRHWLETIYTAVYEQTRDDPRIVAMLSQVPHSVPALPL